MSATLFGVVVGFGVVIAGIYLCAPAAAMMFIDYPSILIVVGGTLAACFIAMKASDVKLGFMAAARSFKKSSEDTTGLITEIIQFSKDSRGDKNAMRALVEGVKDPFFKEGIMLILDRIPPDRIESMLFDRVESERKQMDQEVTALRNLGKYPPAFGMIGTVIGLVGVLQGLGTPEGNATLGASMAVGLITTLYGLLLSNLAFAPMTDKTQAAIDARVEFREIAMLGVMLIISGDSAVIVQESLNSRLAGMDRIDVLGIREGSKKAA